MLQIDQAIEYPLSRKRLFMNIFEMILYDDDQFTIGILRLIQAFAREKGYTLNRRHLIIDIVKMLRFKIELLEVINSSWIKGIIRVMCNKRKHVVPVFVTDHRKWEGKSLR